jgi:mannosylglycerate hydrolase
MKFHVISHTHWDREWHQTYQQYRVKLIRFMDDLLELLETTPAYASFLLDGQTIVLEDYLEIKPKNRDRIGKLVKEGRLVIGPWYIQPDEFTPSGESLVRNLLIGQQIGDEFGPSMQIGYLPDSFGQAAQIPQVLSGFGMNYALFWRGITNEETEKTDFWWVGPDGSKVLATHLPLGYGNGRMLSTDFKQNLEIIHENNEKLKEMTTSSNMLLMCGFDQRSANKDLPEIIAELNRHYAEHGSNFEVRLSKLQDYLEEVERAAENLDNLSGDFRKGKNMRVHVSIASTRLDLKKKNFEVQNLYEKYVEPLNAVSFLLGDHYDNDIINKGWKYMMQNHAHDSICNVCTDSTHQEMDMRYEFAKQIGETVQKTATEELLRNINFQDEGVPLVVFNTLGQKRKNLAEATLHLSSKEFTIVDAQGNEVPYQILETKKENLNDRQIEIGVKNEDQFVFTTRIKFAAQVDGFGFSTYYVKEQAPIANPYADVYQNGTFFNEFMEVSIENNGSLTIKEKSGAIYKGLNVFEEGGNAGDEYDFSPPREDILITTKDAAPEISIVHNGPIYASVKIVYNMELPVDTDVFGRSEDRKASTIETFVSVNRYEDRVDIQTVIDNTVKNHRIRALFDTGLQTKTHIADQQFGTIRRDNYLEQVEYWEQENWEEKYYPIYPQQKFVDVSDDQKGIAILNKGLPQYEILHAEKPTIAVTLLAGTDHMGKQDLVDRPGRRSGLHVETPDSLLLGKHEMNYSIVAHAGNDIEASVASKASEFTTPFVTVPVNVKSTESASLEDHSTFIRLDDSGLALSAVKKSENNGSLVVRIYNTTNQPIETAKIEINQNFFKNSKLVNLNETLLPDTDERIQIENHEINLKDIRANEIFSFQLS